MFGAPDGGLVVDDVVDDEDGHLPPAVKVEHLEERPEVLQAEHGQDVVEAQDGDLQETLHLPAHGSVVLDPENKRLMTLKD